VCRLFAIRSTKPFRVTPAFSALAKLSHEHKDGWGVARLDVVPHHLEKSIEPAHGSLRFQALSDSIEATSLFAHVRLASVGTVRDVNSHPFLARGLAFMHNGTVNDFQPRRAKLEAELSVQHRQALLGETDSERCFALVLTYLEGIEAPTLAQLAEATRRAFLRVIELYDVAGQTPSALNFVVSDGRHVVATRRGRTLFRLETGDVSAVASERLWEDPRWVEVPENHLVTIGDGLQTTLVPVA
jgi:predicted glutamine amidotransferase